MSLSSGSYSQTYLMSLFEPAKGRNPHLHSSVVWLLKRTSHPTTSRCHPIRTDFFLFFLVHSWHLHPAVCKVNQKEILSAADYNIAHISMSKKFKNIINLMCSSKYFLLLLVSQSSEGIEEQIFTGQLG